MRVVCASDIHGQHGRFPVPAGDVLVLAGDLTRRGTLTELAEINTWLGTLPHRHKLIIAGNHDFGLEQDPRARELFTHATYLQDEGATVEGLRVWGSPWQPRFFDWAFNLDRGAPLRQRWDLIPEGTELLITHGPPRGVLDRCWDGRRVGCEDLLDAVRRLRPRLHVFGHIHESRGREAQGGTIFVNASVCTQRYKPTQPVQVVDL